MHLHVGYTRFSVFKHYAFASRAFLVHVYEFIVEPVEPHHMTLQFCGGSAPGGNAGIIGFPSGSN